MKSLIARFVREEGGQDVVEYALLAAFISIIAATTFKLIGDDLSTIFGNVKTQADTAAS